MLARGRSERTAAEAGFVIIKSHKGDGDHLTAPINSHFALAFRFTSLEVQ